MESLNKDPDFIVFLDFDGVLHPVKANEHERFRPDAIKLVNLILDELGANVVLSTAWRMDSGSGRFNSWFKNRVIDATPIHEINMKAEHPRYLEVISFLKGKEWTHVPWIAIDDKRGYFPTHSPAYITNAEVGLTEQDAKQVIQIGKSMKFAQSALLNRLGKGTSLE